MQIWRSLDEVPADLGPTAVVIGNFDGVHLGHRHVLARAREIADERSLPVVAVTFDPHLELPRTPWRQHPACGCGWGRSIAAG